MLVLGRKLKERILIGDDIAVTVVRISPESVRLGIDCPREVIIVREELARPAAAEAACAVDVKGID